MINRKRILKLNSVPDCEGPVVYWMNRDMRVRDNWALLFAQELAHERGVPMVVAYNLVTGFLGGGSRQLAFKIASLREIESDLERMGIPLAVTVDERGAESAKQLLRLFDEVGAGAVVTDFSPLRISRKWVEAVRGKAKVPCYGVDAHNIVPCWVASPKQEFGAYTLRPKLHRLIPEFLDDFPKVAHQRKSVKIPKEYSGWKKAAVDNTVGPVLAGERAAKKRMDGFFSDGFGRYDAERNDPNSDAQSGLSPYLHYGNISAQRIVLELMNKLGRKDIRSLYEDAFFEELVVRRELADNFCFYNENYDNPDGFPEWAKKTREKHKGDRREYLYTKKQFEQARTHDPLWNAAQREMVATGRMHGYMRMYWAKKILEWTPDAATAMKIAIHLNDTYELDGRDPNGYAGIAWSIGGTHDRAWFERPVFGQIRYMNANGCAKKFDVEAYCGKWPE